jgi:hypothetical protein
MKELQNLERISGTLGKIRHTDNGIIVQVITETDLILPLDPALAERLEQLVGQKIEIVKVDDFYGVRSLVVSR